MTTDPIKALVDLGPALQRLMSAATATPWGNRGKLSDRIVGPDEKTIAEFVSQALGKNGDEQDEANAVFCTFIVNNTQTILAAIEALTPIAEGTSVVVPVVPTEAMLHAYQSAIKNHIRSLSTEERALLMKGDFTRIKPYEKAKIRYRAMIAAAPASPVVEDVVERMVRAFKAVLLDIDFLIERGHLTDIRNDMIYVEARAALAAIGRT